MSATPSFPLACLNEAIAREMGLYSPPERLSLLRDRLLNCRPEEGEGEIAGWLWRTPWSGEQVRFLARLLTVGETYFFRDFRVFTAIRDELLPVLIAGGRRRGQTLSIWSAGCSTGEEIYSIAILLRELLPDLPSWSLHLWGTDINPDAIEKARAAVYGAWSFRELPAGLRARCFDPLAGGRYRLNAEYRGLARFEEDNLVQPASGRGFRQPADLILCRNVLMYFRAEQALQVLRRLAAGLHPGGWLIVGPSELHLAEQAGLEMRQMGGLYGFVPAGAGPTPPDESSAAAPGDAVARAGPAASRGPADRERRCAPRAESPPDAGRGCAVAIAAAATAIERLLEQATACADQGRFLLAQQRAEAAVALDPVHAGSHLVLGMILQEQGLRQQARQSLKRTVFLDANCALAYFHLGVLALEEQDGRAARAYLQQALALAGDPMAAASPAASNGLAPGELKRMISTVLEVVHV